EAEIESTPQTPSNVNYSSNQREDDAPVTRGIAADFLRKSYLEKELVKPKGTFAALFPYLFKLNVPPQQIQRLIAHLDVRLVFTAHPTEIV
ncbi:MAG: phosphoenolpyruvate carboxylase, partial [Nostoc sp.]